MERKLTQSRLLAFREHLLIEERSRATVDKYLHDLRVFSAFLGDRPLSKATLLEYKAHLSESYAVTSANSMLAALNACLRFLGWQDLCVKQFRVQRAAFCPEEKELTKAEYLRLVGAARAKRNDRLELILQTICSSGIRVSELKYITVEAVKKGEAEVSCKGKNRRIFLVSDLRKRLLGYIGKKGIRSGSVFVTSKGKPLTRHAVWREMKSLCKAAQVAPSKVFPHNLRHLFARTFYRIEKDIAKLADILGHTSINTTRIYMVTTGTEHKRKMENLRLLL